MSPQEPVHRRAVILTALPVEYEAVRAHLKNLREEVHKETVYERGDFIAGKGRWDIGIVQVGAGNARAAAEAERAIDYFAPEIVLFVGVAGGVKDVALGDVVAATKVYGYESGKVAQSGFLARPDVGQSSYGLVQRAVAESRKKDWIQRIRGRNSLTTAPHVLVGAIAAGEKVIAATRSAVYKRIHTTYNDTLAVEMEGRGFLQATYANRSIQALIIRGISDLLDGKNQADMSGSQEIAARHASAFAFEILAKLDAAEFHSDLQLVNMRPNASILQQQDTFKMTEDLRLVSMTIIERGETSIVAIKLYNKGTELALPTRVKIEILDVGEFYHCGDDDEDVDTDRSFIIESHNYDVELSPELKGSVQFVEVDQQLLHQEADLFHLTLYSDVRDPTMLFVWYYLNISVVYNEAAHTTKDVRLLLSVPPVTLPTGDVWKSQHGSCAEKNRVVLQRMAALSATRSDSVEKAIRAIL